MPIFSEHNALFVHIPKNAGRSIEKAFLPSGLTPSSGGRSFVNGLARWALRKTANSIPPQRLLGTLDVALTSQHLTLEEIRLLGLVPERDIDRLFTFCVVRNPYDRVLSSVLHFSRNDKQRLFDLPDRPGAGDFEAAILAWIEVDAPDHNVRAHRRPQSDYVRMKDRANATDFTLRFEHLNDDFDRLRDRLGATGVSLGRTGAGRLRDRDYRDLYTDTSRKAVERAFAADLELFAYCF